MFWVSSGTGNSLKLLGGLGTQGDDGVRGERSFDLWGQSVNGKPLLLTDITADRGQLSPWVRYIQKDYKPLIKGVVYNFKPKHLLSNSENISSVR